MAQLPLPEAITRFLDDLRRAERSPHTVRAYRTELSHLRLPRRASRHGRCQYGARRRCTPRREKSCESRARTMVARTSFPSEAPWTEAHPDHPALRRAERYGR